MLGMSKFLLRWHGYLVRNLGRAEADRIIGEYIRFRRVVLNDPT